MSRRSRAVPADDSKRSFLESRAANLATAQLPVPLPKAAGSLAPRYRTPQPSVPGLMYLFFQNPEGLVEQREIWVLGEPAPRKVVVED
jgi:hypothetical protein